MLGWLGCGEMWPEMAIILVFDTMSTTDEKVMDQERRRMKAVMKNRKKKEGWKRSKK